MDAHGWEWLDELDALTAAPANHRRYEDGRGFHLRANSSSGDGPGGGQDREARNRVRALSPSRVA